MASLILPRRYQEFARKRGWMHRWSKPASKTVAHGAPTENLKEHPGYKPGRVPGGWIWDLVGLRKAIVLCWACQPKFNEAGSHYHKDRRFPYVVGKCDGCKQHRGQSKFYVPQELLTDAGYRSRSGMSWLPE